MNKFKKFLCVGLTSLLALSTSACGGGGGGNTSTDESTVNSESTNVEITGEVEFAVLLAGYGETPYRELAKAYMAKNPGVQVKLRFDYEINSNVENQVNNGVNVADVYSVRDLTQIINFGLNGKAMNLSSMLDTTFGEGYAEANLPVRANLDSKAVSACTLNGKTYCFPEYSSVTGFVYNATLFDQYGWQIPTTTKELEDLCKQIISDTNGTVNPITYCGAAADGYLYLAIDNWLYQYAGIANLDEFYDYGSAELFAPTSKISQGKQLAHENLVKFLADRNDGGYARNGSMAIDHHQAQGELISGTSAMMLNGSWFENEMSAVLEQNPGVEMGMFAFPEMSDASGNILHAEGYTTQQNKRVLDASYGAYYFIPENCDNKEVAVDFLKFLCSDEASIIYTKYTNAVRPVKYNLDPTSADYADLSFFGKSVIGIANSCYLYSAYSTSPLAIDGVVSLYPKGSYWCKLVLQDPVTNTPESKIVEDYNYVKGNWARWQEEYGI
ncbi:MAG: extracellular solute-binding protein [Clostridia bacterium]|nr:extracellular solute-binding protein [Clostridia bacterium]